jgi:hypothetical protein
MITAFFVFVVVKKDKDKILNYIINKSPYIKVDFQMCNYFMISDGH